MTMLRDRRFLCAAALSALVLLGGWVAGAVFHEHAGDPTCQVCKLIHSGAADVVNPVELPAIESVSAAVPQPAAEPLRTTTPSTPPGRAPPLA
ncbi:MAG TPA: hypothetical protein VLT84_08415 [Acidobacteriota bacterium]|nr:hypothetical protein [Acidobacteriota bacterium]